MSPLFLTKSLSSQDAVCNVTAIAKARPINKDKSLIMPKISAGSLFRQSRSCTAELAAGGGQCLSSGMKL